MLTKPFGRIIVVVINVGFLLAILVLSPVVLIAVQNLFPIDWNQLSAVGQSYTGVAALLSGGALAGVVYSIRLQVRQVELARGQSLRDLHFRLLGMAMDDPTLMYAAVGRHVGAGEHARFRYEVYLNQWLRYLEFSFLSGEISEEGLRVGLINEMFAIAPNRSWWAKVRPRWAPGIESTSPRYKEFFRVVNEAHFAAGNSG